MWRAALVFAACLVSVTVFFASQEARPASAATIETVSCTSPGTVFNTAWDPVAGARITPTNTSLDLHWQVSNIFPLATDPIGYPLTLPPAGTPFFDAFVVGRITSAWTASPLAQADWISRESRAKPTSGGGIYYYRYQFYFDPLVVTDSFTLSLKAMADNRISGIWVNSVVKSGPLSATYTSSSASEVTLDGFGPGLNEILVQLATSPTYEGLLLEATGDPECLNGTLPDTGTTPVDTTLIVSDPEEGVLANDTPGMTVSTNSQVTTEKGGTATVHPDGTYEYVPPPGYSGIDTFQYTAGDGVHPSVTDTVTITVTPLGIDDTAITPHDTPVLIDVLANDKGSQLVLQGTTPAAHGTTTIGTGGVTYTPAAGFVGTDTFTYTAIDSSGQVLTKTVTVTILGGTPALSISKVASSPIVTAGGNTVFTITISNTATDTTAIAHAVSVSDTLGAGLTYTPGTASAFPSTDFSESSASAQGVLWSIASLAPGQSVVITVPASVAGTASAGTVLMNTASVTSEENPDPKAATATVTVAAQADLSLTKLGPQAPIAAGAQFSYTLTISNNGPSAAVNTTLSDPLPNGLSYVSGDNAECSASGQLFSCAFGLLAAGSSRTVTLTVKAAVDASGQIANTATVSTDTNDPVPANNTSTYAVSFSQMADLAITKTGPSSTVGAGEAVTYTLSISNNGPSDAVNSVLSDALPVGLTYVSNDSNACSASGQLFTCAFGTLKSGETRLVHLTVKTDPAISGSFSNTASLQSDTPDPTTTNNSSTATSVSEQRADVSIRKTSDKTVYLGGDLVTYTLTVHNNGPSTATNVSVEDALPANLNYLPGSVSAGSAICNDPLSSGGQLECSISTIATGADEIITFKMSVPGTAPQAATEAHTHQITLDKAEQYVSLGANKSTTFDVTCPANGYAVDGSVQIVNVAQGYQKTDVIVTQASSVAPGTYRFSATNTTPVQAQLRAHIVCMPAMTASDGNPPSHGVVIGALVEQTSAVLTPGTYTFYVPYSGGHSAVAQGITVLSGRANLVGNEPGPNNTWRYTVLVSETATVQLSLREMDSLTAPAGNPEHVHAFDFLHVEEIHTLQAGVNEQIRVSCPVGYKGIVGTYELPDGVIATGSVPEPINRDFDVYNPNGFAVDALFDLECINISTAQQISDVSQVSNTAQIASAIADPDAANNVDSTIISTSATGVGGVGGSGSSNSSDPPSMQNPGGAPPSSSADGGSSAKPSGAGSSAQTQTKNPGASTAAPAKQAAQTAPQNTLELGAPSLLKPPVLMSEPSLPAGHAITPSKNSRANSALHVSLSKATVARNGANVTVIVRVTGSPAKRYSGTIVLSAQIKGKRLTIGKAKLRLSGGKKTTLRVKVAKMLRTQLKKGKVKTVHVKIGSSSTTIKLARHR
jgi:uncharacterized repeat protein (TIGR01451 family)